MIIKRCRCVLFLKRFLTGSLTESTGEGEVKTGGNLSKVDGQRNEVVDPPLYIELRLDLCCGRRVNVEQRKIVEWFRQSR